MRSAKASAIDSKRNTIYQDNVVKIVAGKHKGRRGVIKFIHRNTVFLWDRDFKQTNGIFVENTNNILILGDEHMKSAGI